MNFIDACAAQQEAIDQQNREYIMKDQWQQRVVEEKDELMKKAEKLRIFMNNLDLWDNVPVLEQLRLERQVVLMDLYAEVLIDRIQHFNKTDETN